jgi:predicted Fe-Mo cluster-binding NifX family protein
MKVAITSSANHPQAQIDSRFGRCSFFAIFDTESKSTEFLPNPNRESIEGAGPASVQLLASKGVQKVVSGEFGAKVKSLFDSLKVQLIIVSDSEKTIEQIIEMLEKS